MGYLMRLLLPVQEDPNTFFTHASIVADTWDDNIEDDHDVNNFDKSGMKKISDALSPLRR